METLPHLIGKRIIRFSFAGRTVPNVPGKLWDHQDLLDVLRYIEQGKGCVLWPPILTE